MPLDAEKWLNEMIEKGYVADSDGKYHWKKVEECNEQH